MTCISRSAFADMLVRFPLGADPVGMNLLLEGIKKSTGIKVVAVATVRSTDDGLPNISESILQKYKQAEDSYKNVLLEKTIETLKTIDEECIKTASFEACRSLVFDSALLRGMSAFALGQISNAEHEFRNAYLALPTGILDPKKYSPNILRAYASACADLQNLPQAEIKLNVRPKEANVFVNGELSNSRSLRLSPGTHVLEGRLLGYRNTTLIIKVDSSGQAEKEISLKLEPKPNASAWGQLIEEISKEDWNPTEVGVSALLKRFNIDFVLMLDFSIDGAYMLAELARSDRREIVELPKLSAPWSSLPEGFDIALQTYMGKPPNRQENILNPSASQTVEYNDEEDDGELDEDDEPDEFEDTSIRFKTPDKPEEAVPVKKKGIHKKPWFWISTIAITAIISGVAISIAVQD